MKAYVALIKSSAVRDVQVCKGKDPDPLSDDWEDCREAEVFIGVYRECSEEEAIKEAARYACTVPENIRLISIK